MADIQRIEHAKVHVRDLDVALAFYTDAMGLVEVDRTSETVYLGCGLDGNFDLAVSEGGTGIEHVAVRASDATVVDDYEDRLSGRGVDVHRVDGDEPGQAAGVRFELPSGVPMEVVAVADGAYEHATASTDGRAGQAPSTLDHVQLFTPDVNEDLAFLRDVVGLRISDVGETEEGAWRMAFTRVTDYHHDVALFDDPDDSLHHLAWEMNDVSHLTAFADHLASRGHRLEVSPVRHGPGSNVAAYFQEPGGNRFEITTEVETVDPDAEMVTHAAADVPFCVWGGQVPPESFREGS